MKYDPDKHHRRSVRLEGYDYSQSGAYFVTICTQLRYLFFDDTRIREAAEQCWEAIPDHFPRVELDHWVVMPNHLHGILMLDDNGKGVQLNAPTPRQTTRYSQISPHKNTLAVIVRTYKAAVTSACRKQNLIEFAWQRSYFERVVRSENELNRIRQYIIDNPAKWAEDRENPHHNG